MITMQKAKIPSHVTMNSTPSLYRLGAKEVSPPKKRKLRGKPPTVFTGSTVHSVAQNLTICKEKYYKLGHVAEECDVPCFYMSVGMDCRSVPFIQPHCPGSGAGRLIAAPTEQFPIRRAAHCPAALPPLQKLKNFSVLCHNSSPLCVFLDKGLLHSKKRRTTHE